LSDQKITKETKDLLHSAKDALKSLARIDGELAQIIITEDENGNRIPNWFLIEITKELPRLLKTN